MTDDIPTCTKCGQQHICFQGTHQACTAHKSGQPHVPCTKHPIEGTHLCRNHGGANPRLQAKAARQKADREARKAVVTLGEPIDTDPVEGMRNLIAWSVGHVTWYRQQLRLFKPDALVWGETEVRESDLSGLTITQKAQLNAWLKLYNDERDRLAKLFAVAMHHGLAEREIRAIEQEGDQIGEAMVSYARKLAERVELSPDQLRAAVSLVPEVLLEIDRSTREERES